MLTATERISILVKSVEETRVKVFEDLDQEFELSSQWLASAIESCKRKISVSGGLERKKRIKISSDKENSNPNEKNLVQKGEKFMSVDSIPEGDGNDIDVYSMKVVELRKELRSRGLEANGLKKDLQKRLEDALTPTQREKEVDEKVDEQLDAQVNEQVDEHVDGRAEEHAEEDVGEEHVDDNDMNDVESVSKSDNEGNGEEESEDMEVEVLGETHVPNCDRSDYDVRLEEQQQQQDVLEEENSLIDVEQEESEPAKIEEVTSLSNLTCPSEDSETQEQDGNPIDSNMDELISDVDEVMADSSGGDAFKYEATDREDMSTVESEVCQEIKDELTSPKKKKFGSKLKKLFSPKKKSPKKMTSPKVEIKSEGSGVSSTALHSKVFTDDSKGASMVSNMTEEKMKELKNEQEKRRIREALESATRERLSAPSKTSESSASTNESAASSQLRAFDTPGMHGKPLPTIHSTSASSSLSSNSSSISLSTKSQAKKKALAEARKARLEKMRGKVQDKKLQAMAASKGIHSSTPSQVTTPATNSTFKIGGTDKVERKKALAAEMRLKVASASKSQTLSSKKPPSTQPVLAPVTVQTQLQQSARKALAHQQQQAQQRSPMDTYEMSDRGESDSDSDESEYSEKAAKKRVPHWALKANLIPALEKQFLEDANNKADPDEIFHEVSTCNLVEIFGDKKKQRYVKRTSSGNWTKDRVTATEKLVYKRKMGFDK